MLVEKGAVNDPRCSIDFAKGGVLSAVAMAASAGPKRGRMRLLGIKT